MVIIKTSELKKGMKIYLSKMFRDYQSFYCKRIFKKFKENYGVDVYKIEFNIERISYDELITSFEAKYGKEYYTFSFAKFKFETKDKLKYLQFLN